MTLPCRAPLVASLLGLFTSALVVVAPAASAATATRSTPQPVRPNVRGAQASSDVMVGPVGTLTARRQVALPQRSATSPVRAALPSGAASTWTNLGPTGAGFERNSLSINGTDSGRITKVRADPTDANRVYVATAGGGIWKTDDISAPTPTWTPMTDGQPSLATGALALYRADPTHLTVYAGLGEEFDPGDAGGSGPGAVITSVDGGATWGSPVLLSTATVQARSVRDIVVDPNTPSIVMVATDIGLFRSADSGATYTLLTLPGATAPAQVTQLAYLGVAAGHSGWLVAGAQSGTQLGVGTAAGDLWRSTDDGATWTSVSAQAGVQISAANVGRIAISATSGAGNDPATATVWALAANPAGNATAGILRSTDGGQNFTTVATSATALSNPTTGSDCTTANVADVQSYYDLAIAADPSSPNNAIAGGELCMIRTTNAGASWQAASDWLPAYGGSTANGTLPYVHADTQDIGLYAVSGVTRAVVGSDGGVGLANAVFGTTPENVTWTTPNAGLATHQFYSVASGDTAHGDAAVVFGGTQDNGQRFHSGADPAGSFDMVTGGDGIGTSVGRTSAGSTVYWGSAEYQWEFCRAAAVGGCDSSSTDNWSQPTMPALTGGDAWPFLIGYSPLAGDANGGQVSWSTYDVWLLSSADPTLSAVKLSNHFANPLNRVSASQFTYASGDRLLGVAMVSGHTAVGVLPQGSTTPTWTVASGTLPVYGAGTIAFPRHASSLGGATDGGTYLVGARAAGLPNGTPVPAATGHLFLTTDGGTTFTAFHGNGTGHDLPNVPVEKVLFDPLDSTDSTIYVATSIGVYVTGDAGATWSLLGTGLPEVSVQDMAVTPDGVTMRVATFGRGIWELPLRTATATTLTDDKPSPAAGQSLQLTASIAPSSATGSVTFYNGSTSLGTASVGGGSASLTTGALGQGSYDFRADYAGDGADGTSSGTLHVTVGPAVVASISLSPNPATVPKGLTQQFTATGLYTDGATHDVTSQATWSSDSPAIATVSSTGNATGTSTGSTTIRAHIPGATDGTAAFNVSSATLTAISVTAPSASLPKGGSEQLTALGHYTDGSTQDLSSQAAWSTGNAALATVDATGRVTALGTGTVSIAASMSAVTSPGTTLSLTAPPTIGVVAPPVVTLLPKLYVGYSGHTSAGTITSYDYRFRKAGPTSTAFSAWSTPATTTATKVAMALSGGQTVCVIVRARDSFGAVSTWSVARCSARALDDPGLTPSSGWSRVLGRTFYGGSARRTTAKGATLRLANARVDRLAVVVRRCPGCGSIAVSIGGRLIAKLDLGASAVRDRVVLLLPKFTYRLGTVVITTLSTKPVYVDGLAATRI